MLLKHGEKTPVGLRQKLSEIVATWKTQLETKVSEYLAEDIPQLRIKGTAGFQVPAVTYSIN